MFGCIGHATYSQTTHDSLFLLATQFMEFQQFQKAQSVLNECYNTVPRDMRVLEKLATCYYQQGNFRDSKLFYKEILKIDSTHTTAWSALGSMANRERNYKEAKACYAQLMYIDSSNATYARQYGQVCMDNEEWMPALSALISAHNKNYFDMLTIEALARLSQMLNDTSQTKYFLEKGLAIDSQNLILLQQKGQFLYSQKTYAQAVPVLEKIRRMGDRSEYATKLLGYSYVYVQQADSAIVVLESLLEQDRDPELTLYHLGLAYQQKGLHDKASVQFEAAAKAGISNNMPMYYRNLAIAREQQKSYGPAIEAYKESIRYKSQPELLFHIAKNYEYWYKDKRPALDYYQQYVATKHTQYQTLSKERIQYLKEYLHQRQ